MPTPQMPVIVSTKTAVYHAAGKWFVVTEVLPVEITVATSGIDREDVARQHLAKLTHELEPVLAALTSS